MLESARKMVSASPVAGQLVVLAAPEPLLLWLSQTPSQGIHCEQAWVTTPRCCSLSLQARRVKCSKQTRDIMDLKVQMAQVLELLTRQQAPAAPAAAPALPLPAVPYPPSPRGDQSKWEALSQMAEEDALSIAASWGESSFPTEMEEGGEPELSAEAQPSSEVVLEASVPPLSSSTSALMGHAATFLQVLWTTAAEKQAVAPRPQPPARSPSQLPRFHGGGMEKLGLAGFPSVDSTIAALVKAPPVGGLPKDPVCPNPQYRVTETHLKRAYAAEEQVTHLANTAGILTTYMDSILREAPLPEPMATELRLLSGTLLQISGLQGQALGRSLASLIVAPRQLWLSR
ncbi:UNVERIFIED_CONTAM: hypothetical protein FKN15_064024 [Acipenser sinensis]